MTLNLRFSWERREEKEGKREEKKERKRERRMIRKVTKIGYQKYHSWLTDALDTIFEFYPLSSRLSCFYSFFFSCFSLSLPYFFIIYICSYFQFLCIILHSQIWLYFLFWNQKDENYDNDKSFHFGSSLCQWYQKRKREEIEKRKKNRQRRKKRERKRLVSLITGCVTREELLCS